MHGAGERPALQLQRQMQDANREIGVPRLFGSSAIGERVGATEVLGYFWDTEDF